MDLENIHSFKIYDVKSEGQARDLIRKNNGLTALVHDEHSEGYYLVGKIEPIEGDNQAYKLKGSKKESILHYHDLLSLATRFF